MGAFDLQSPGAASVLRLGGQEQQQIERLLARIAAKDAVRSLFHQLHGVAVYPADIDLVVDDSGRSEPGGYWQQELAIHAWRFRIAVS